MDIKKTIKDLDILRREAKQLIEPNEVIPCKELSAPEALCEHPVVSVHMLTYNHEPFIREAIESVVSQKCDFEFELVIGEDCSTDTTRAICFEYQKKYPNIIRVLYSDRNVGVQRNSLRLINNLRGTYVAFLEGDDYWIRADKLQLQVDFLRKMKGVKLCVGEWIAKNEITGTETSRQSRGKIIKATFLRYSFHHVSTWMMSRLLLKRFSSLAQTCPLSDSFLITQTMIDGPVYILPYKFSVYRITGLGVWSSVVDLPSRVLMRLSRVHPQYCIARRKRWIFAQTIHSDYWYFIKLFIKHKRYFDAIRYMYYSILLFVLNPFLLLWIPFCSLDRNVRRIWQACRIYNIRHGNG